jgi:hypothetical protein
MKLLLIKSIVFTCCRCGRWAGRLPAWADLGEKEWQCEGCYCTSAYSRAGRAFGPRSQQWQSLVKEFHDLELADDACFPEWREWVVVEGTAA